MTLEQLKDESIKEFHQLEIKYKLTKNSVEDIVEPLCLGEETEKVIIQFLLSQLEKSYTQGVNDTVEKVEKIINGAENLFKESHEFVEADAREMCQICGKDKDDHEDYLFGNIRQQLETLKEMK